MTRKERGTSLLKYGEGSTAGKTRDGFYRGDLKKGEDHIGQGIRVQGLIEFRLCFAFLA